MGRIEKRLPKKIMDVLEDCGWRLNSIEKQDGEYCAEIENWSPAGEDLPETIWYNGTGKGFVEAVQEWASDYDAPDDYPSFGPHGNVYGMKKKYYGKDALLVRSGAYVYHVPAEIYNQAH